MAYELRQSVRNGASMWHRVNGVFLLIASLGVGGIGYVVLSLIARSLRENSDTAQEVSPHVITITHNRWLLLVFIVPSVVAGLMLLLSSHRGRWRWPAFALGMIWVVVLMSGVLYAFIMFLAPLYQYQPL
jgi:hypothetical protein